MSLGMRIIRWALATALLAGIAFLCAERPNSPNLTLYLVAFALTYVATLYRLYRIKHAGASRGKRGAK